MFHIEIKEVGIWLEVDFHKEFLIACYLASSYVELHGENAVRIKDKNGKVLC